MSTSTSLPGMSYNEALVAYICAHRTGPRLDPRDVERASFEHEDYYANEDCDWPERNYVSYRIIGNDAWQSIDIHVSHNEFLYDLLRVGLMTTLIPTPDEEA